jgi:hypothetical protein
MFHRISDDGRDMKDRLSGADFPPEASLYRFSFAGSPGSNLG